MKASLQPGLRYTHRFVIPPTKTVQALYPEAPEFVAMPEVFAVEVHDGVDRISRGRHERFVIYREKFDARVNEKKRSTHA